MSGLIDLGLPGMQVVGAIDLGRSGMQVYQPMGKRIISIFDFVPTAASTGSVTLSIPTGKSISIDWGDGGTPTEVTGPQVEKKYSHAYSSAGAYSVVLNGDYKSVAYIEIKDIAVSGTLKRIGRLSNLNFFICGVANTIFGSLLDLPSDLTFFRCYGSNTISGSLSDLPSNLFYFACTGDNTVSGSLSDAPSGLNYFNCLGSNTISGSLSDLPRSLILFRCEGLNTVSGSLSDLLNDLNYFRCTGSNTISDYTTKTWTKIPARLECIPVSPGGLSSTEIDTLLADFVAAEISDVTFILIGANKAPGAAGLASITTLVDTYGWDITYTGM